MKLTKRRIAIGTAIGCTAVAGYFAADYLLTGGAYSYKPLLNLLYNIRFGTQAKTIQPVTTMTHTTTQTMTTSITQTITQSLTQTMSIQPYEVVRLFAQKEGTTYNTFLQHLANIKMPYEIIGQSANDDTIIAAMEAAKLKDPIWTMARREVAGKVLDAIAVKTPNGLFIFDEKTLSNLLYAFQL